MVLQLLKGYTHKGRRYINSQCQKVSSASIHSHPTTMHNSTQNSINHTSMNMLTNLLGHALELLLKGFLHCLAHHHYVLVGKEQHTFSVLAVHFLVVVNRALSKACDFLLVSHCKKMSGPLQFVTRIEKSDHFGHFQRCVFHNGILQSNIKCRLFITVVLDVEIKSSFMNVHNAEDTANLDVLHMYVIKSSGHTVRELQSGVLQYFRSHRSFGQYRERIELQMSSIGRY